MPTIHTCMWGISLSVLISFKNEFFEILVFEIFKYTRGPYFHYVVTVYTI